MHADTALPRLVLARDVFVRTNRRAIAVMLVLLSVCLCLGQAFIVIIWCTLARIKFMAEWSNVLGTLTPKHVHLFRAVFFMYMLSRHDISRTVEDRG